MGLPCIFEPAVWLELELIKPRVGLLTILSLSGWLLQEAEVGVAPTHDSVSSCNAVLKTDKSEGLQQVRQKTVNSN